MTVLWVFLPVLGAFVTHAPVLKWDWFKSLKRPLDGGCTWRGRRVFGDNKTWRGAAAMFTGVLGGAVVLSRVPGYWARLPAELQRAGPVVFGGLLGLGVVLGELPNSFLKRQWGVEPGRQRRDAAGLVLSIVDQGDFVLGAWATLAPVWAMSVREAASAFVLVVVVHLVVNVIGYAAGVRKTWL
jgi:hypothetical protein